MQIKELWNKPEDFNKTNESKKFICKYFKSMGLNTFL